MNNFDYFLDAWKRSFDFKGVSTRREYWWFFGWYLITFAAMVIAMQVAIQSLESIAPVVVWGGIIYLFCTIIPNVSITIRRTRDTGKPMWWWAITFIPYVGGLFLLWWLVQPSKSSASHNS